MFCNILRLYLWKIQKKLMLFVRLHLKNDEEFAFFCKTPSRSENWVLLCDCDSLYHMHTAVQVGWLPGVGGCARAELKCDSCGQMVGIHCELHQAILLAQITSPAPAPLRFKPDTASSPGPLDSQVCLADRQADGRTTLEERLPVRLTHAFGIFINVYKTLLFFSLS